MNSEKETEAVDTNVDTWVDTNVDTAQRFARIYTDLRKKGEEIGQKEEAGNFTNQRKFPASLAE